MQEKGRLNSGKDQDYASGLIIGTYKGLPIVATEALMPVTVRTWSGFRRAG
jgi:hypothetical protein